MKTDTKSVQLLVLVLLGAAVSSTQADAPRPLAATTAAAAPRSTASPKQTGDLPASIVLENSKGGFKVVLSPIGATIQSILVPHCKTGKPVDVALGYDDIAGYLTDPHPSYGATVGRVANRISDAKFTLDGRTYSLLPNEGRHSIHGGAARWSKATWSVAKSDSRSVTFTLKSKDGEGGFPGNVDASVTYSIPADGMDLAVSMGATTDKATPINMLNHAYFNLKGSGSGDILDHLVQIPSQYYTPSPPGDLLPTGKILSVKGSVYDFGAPKAIGRDVERANGGPFKGFDLNYVMPDASGSMQPVWWTPGTNPQVAPNAATRKLQLGATVTEPASGLKLKVLTNAPGIHFYSGNFMSESGSAGPTIPNKGGLRYPQHTGFCFETQGFPNAINTPGFPSVVVRPGESYSNRVTYSFSC